MTIGRTGGGIGGRAVGALPRNHGQPSSRTRGPSDAPRRGARALRARYTFADILGDSPALQEALKLARAVARAPHLKPVLILGESGTGKEVIAHAIHSESERADKPFVAVNCGALPRELVESELFGYSSGAFTGARREGQAGKFEAAQGGTVFLDEVDSMPMEVQAKLLRVIETGEVVRLGSTQPVGLDVAIMAATGPDARRRVEEGVVPPRPVPPAERRRDRHASASRASGRHPAAGGGVPGSGVRGVGAGAPRPLPRSGGPRSWPFTGRATSESCRTCAPGGPSRWRAVRSAPKTFPRISAAARARGRKLPVAEASAGERTRSSARRCSRPVATWRRPPADSAINKTTIYRRMKRWESEQGVASCTRGGRLHPAQVGPATPPRARRPLSVEGDVIVGTR